MRRCKDDWVNATQILKCCNFPKAKRTKILEKGVQQGMHEKIQGGYGRFQGTWIPLPDALRLAGTYGLHQDLAPVIYLDFTNMNIPRKVKPAAGSVLNKDGTPVKRKYTKKAKKDGSSGGTPSKKLKKSDLQLQLQQAQTSQIIPVSQPSQQQPQHLDLYNSQDTFASLSRAQSQLSNAQSPPPSQNSSIPSQHQMTYTMNNNMNTNGNHLPTTFQQNDFMNATNGNMPAYTSHNQSVQNEFQNYQLQYQRLQQQQQMSQQIPQHLQQPQQQQYVPNNLYPPISTAIQPQHHNSQQPQLPQPQPQPQPQIMGHFRHNNKKVTLTSQSTNDTQWSLDEHKESDTSISSNESSSNPRLSSIPSAKRQQSLKAESDNLSTELPQSPSHLQHEQYNQGDMDDESSYGAQLLKFFSEDNSQIPYFVHNPPYDFNINEAIDDEGHTPLHWAASIGNYSMIHILVTKGANPLVVNNFGLNPLSKLISFNNCFELKNFPKVLDDLELCLINTDINGRTPLHYLCQFSKVKSKFESLNYYLGLILNKLTSLSEQNITNTSVNLLKNVLDHQDVNGDTCLHLAARAGCSKLVKIFLSYGTRDDLVNVSNETAKSIIVNFNLMPYDFDKESQPQVTIQQQHQHQHQQQHHHQHQNQQQQQIHHQHQQLLPPNETEDLSIPQKQSSRQNQQYLNSSFSQKVHNSQDHILTTPVQSKSSNGNTVETPDTQRTTVQDDDLDDEDGTRVHKDHLNNIIKSEDANMTTSTTNNDMNNASNISIDDNKENIFIDDSFKSYESISTPKSSSNSLNPTLSSKHQPLTVISERTAESTPIKVQDDRKKFLEMSFTHDHKPQPPKLDDEGRIIEDVLENDEDENNFNLQSKSNSDTEKDDEASIEKLPKLLMNDLSSMINGMLNSLSDSYSQDLTKVNKDFERTKASISDKKSSINLSVDKIKIILNKNGIENFESIDDGKALLSREIETFEINLNKSKVTLLKELEKNQLSDLENAIQEEILKSNDDDDQRVDSAELMADAVHLTQLQLERSGLMNQVMEKIQNYGLDSKMYKYRKLISLSCGLKVEDIDGLIDGIEESLMETSIMH